MSKLTWNPHRPIDFIVTRPRFSGCHKAIPVIRKSLVIAGNQIPRDGAESVQRKQFSWFINNSITHTWHMAYMYANLANLVIFPLTKFWLRIWKPKSANTWSAHQIEYLINMLKPLSGNLHIHTHTHMHIHTLAQHPAPTSSLKVL